MTDDTPTLHLLPGAATHPGLENWGPLEEATGPEMETSGITIFDDGNGVEAGIWECTPGPSRWELETHEVVQVLAGRMTVTEDGGGPVELGAGDVAVFPKGWKGTWDITETVRKMYVLC